MADSAGGRPYVRLSLMRPKSGQAAQVSEILNDLVKFFSAQPGYLDGYTLVSADPESETGRLTLWRSERDAEHVANTQHVLSLRADLMRLVESGSHLEKSFQGEGPPSPGSGPN